jgi:hypothetical protein
MRRFLGERYEDTLSRVVVDVAKPAPVPSDAMPTAAQIMGVNVEQVQSGGQGGFARPLPRHEPGGDAVEQSLQGRLQEAERPEAAAPVHVGDSDPVSPVLRETVSGPTVPHPSRIREATEGPPIGELSQRGSLLRERVNGEKR